MTNEEIDRRFDHHPPSGEKIGLHTKTRAAFKSLAHSCNGLPESREKSLALTSLEEGLMWANAAIARNPIDPTSPPKA